MGNDVTIRKYCIDAIQSCLRSERGNIWAYYCLFTCHMILGQRSLARATICDAAQVTSLPLVALMHHRWIGNDSGISTECSRILQRLPEEHPMYVYIQFDPAFALHANAHYTAAIHHHNQVIQRGYVQAFIALTNRDFCWLQLNEPAQATSDLASSQRIHPSYDLNRVLQADIAEMTGDFDLAFLQTQPFCKPGRTDIPFLIHTHERSLCYDTYNNAIDDLIPSLDADPTNTEALCHLVTHAHYNQALRAISLKRCLIPRDHLGVQSKDMTYVATVVGYLQRAVCG